MAKILIVEDEKSLNQAYELVLKKASHDIDVAFNGEEALAAFKQNQPDLILLDLRMPKMGGVDFLRKLNPVKNYPDVKIIIFSNYDDQKEVDEALRLGGSHYILKAWSSPRELVRLVDNTLREKNPALKR